MTWTWYSIYLLLKLWKLVDMMTAAFTKFVVLIGYPHEGRIEASGPTDL